MAEKVTNLLPIKAHVHSLPRGQGALEAHAGVEKSTRLGGSGGRLVGEANWSAGPMAWGTALSQQLLLDAETAETSMRHLRLETARTELRLWSALP